MVCGCLCTCICVNHFWLARNCYTCMLCYKHQEDGVHSIVGVCFLFADFFSDAI